jgi:O-antigen/teichoic acid export membrane protein
MERMNALLAVVVGAVGNWLQYLFYLHWARDHADPTAPVNQEDRRELLRVSMKSLPNAVFFCFQGQVTLLILTLFGNPTGIADITALGRLAALFAVLSTTFANVLTPRFMRCQDPVRLPKLYLSLVSATMLLLLPFAASAWFLPRPFLWLLGNKYAGLETECGWVVAAGCIGQIGGVMWSLNSSKAWIRVQAIGFIPAIVAMQVIAVLFLDLRQFHDILIFNVVTTMAPVFVYICDAWLGLRVSRQLV